MNQWERQLKQYNSIKEELALSEDLKEGKLRFNRSVIAASDIAGQYYCEKKVEMQYLHGDIETEAKNLGTLAHEKLLEDSIKIKIEHLWQKIYEKKPLIAQELPLFANYKSVMLAGNADSVLFYGGYPLLVFEYKFSRRKRPFPSHHIQAGTYCLLLREMGFNTDNLYYAIVIVDPTAKDDRELKRRVIDVTLEKELDDQVIELQNALIYVNKFDPVKAEHNLDWAIEFWTKQREATPTNNLNKCKVCEYNPECKKNKASLARATRSRLETCSS